MTTTAISLLPVVIDRAGPDLPVWGQERYEAMKRASQQLWDDEYETWQALHHLGLGSAAACAWERRRAAAELSLIIMHAG